MATSTEGGSFGCRVFLRYHSPIDPIKGPALKPLSAIVLISLLVPVQLFGWGPKGHQVVADLAASRLTAQTRDNIALLLGGETLASISNWADSVRKERDESYGWH